jgi:molybdopterin/thiamine biosynthesis adenylyltransferase
MTSITFKIPKALKEKIDFDLSRKHSHAYERVGFVLTKTYKTNNNLIILAYDYEPVDDENYIVDEEVGAKINSKAIKNSIELAHSNNCGVFHVHKHEHSGKPIESKSDIDGINPLIKSVSNINKEAFGYVIFSQDSALCKVIQDNEFTEVNTYSEVGYPMNFSFSENLNLNVNSERQKRQTFLGNKAPNLMKQIKIGVIGYGGGGSHIGQQLAHIGFGNITIFDHDTMEESNINRLVGSHQLDIDNGTPKIDIATRTINNISPLTKVTPIKSRWQDNPEILHQCDVIIGGVDSFTERQQLENECRRYLIPLIDIGMDIHDIENSFSISGQIIMSLPGRCCMQCIGFITEKKLAVEAVKYGGTGGNPQVVWSNGVLASSAVGVLVDLVFGWSEIKDRDVYISYDGNLGVLKDNPRLRYKPDKCEHFPINQIGPVVMKKL